MKLRKAMHYGQTKSCFWVKVNQQAKVTPFYGTTCEVYIVCHIQMNESNQSRRSIN